MRVMKDVAHDRERHRVEHRATQRLKCTRRDQHPEVGSRRTQGRADHECHQPGLEHAPAPEPIARRPTEHQQTPQHQRVCVDDPLQPVERRVQRAIDRGQRDVDDR
jgi:hypothetical protein